MEPSVSADEIRQALADVIDPEVGVDVFNLGLIYEVLVADDGHMQVKMTMTTPACPVGSMLADQVRDALRRLPQVSDVEVELVWDPPWKPEMMSDQAREQLGW